jgi:hypothetical protein
VTRPSKWYSYQLVPIVFVHLRECDLRSNLELLQLHMARLWIKFVLWLWVASMKRFAPDLLEVRVLYAQYERGKDAAQQPS